MFSGFFSPYVKKAFKSCDTTLTFTYVELNATPQNWQSSLWISQWIVVVVVVVVDVVVVVVGGGGDVVIFQPQQLIQLL